MKTIVYLVLKAIVEVNSSDEDILENPAVAFAASVEYDLTSQDSDFEVIDASLIYSSEECPSEVEKVND